MPNGSSLPLAKLDRFTAHGFQGRRWTWVDPKKDVEANILAMQAGLTSPQQVAAAMGQDLEDVLTQIQTANQLASGMGVQLATQQPLQPQGGAQAGQGMQEFGAAAQQGLLQGLRTLDLGQDINAVLDKSLEGTTDYLTRLSQEQTAALLGLLENGLLDDLVKNIDLASASWDDINTRIAQFARIADLKPLFDRVGVSITEFGVDLVNAVGGIDNATAVLNNAINFQQAAAGSANSFAAAIRDIRYGVLDDPGKYEFLDREAQKQRDILASLSDATLIQDYSERLKESIVAAFGLLDPAEQSARSDDFVKKLEEAATLTQERLAVANEAQTL
jgi:hypothetical protein